jgi:hypothetical protein
MFRNPGTPGGRSPDSDEEVFARPPAGTRVGQSRPGPVEKTEDDVPGKPGEFGSSVAIEDTGAEPGPDKRNAYDFELNLREGYGKR